MLAFLSSKGTTKKKTAAEAAKPNLGRVIGTTAPGDLIPSDKVKPSPDEAKKGGTVEGDDAHLISLFGGDSEVGAITAAIHEKHTFTVTFLDGSQKVIGFGPDAICYRGSINLQGRKHAQVMLRPHLSVSHCAVHRTS